MWSRGWQERQESGWWPEMGRQSSLGVPSMAQQGLRDRAERSSVTLSPQRLGPAAPTRGAPALNPGSLCLWTSVSPLQPLPWWEDYVRRSTCRLMLGEGAGVHCGLLAGGAPQHSLHLSALVQLVQEIPEFLFGEGSPESSGGASLDGVAVSSQVPRTPLSSCDGGHVPSSRPAPLPSRYTRGPAWPGRHAQRQLVQQHPRSRGAGEPPSHQNCQQAKACGGGEPRSPWPGAQPRHLQSGQ